MEDMKLYLKDSKMYKVNLSEGDILVLSIPSIWYSRAEALKRVTRLTREIEEYFSDNGVSNPILVLPDEMKVFKLETKSLAPMEEIDPELEGFEDDFKL